MFGVSVIAPESNHSHCLSIPFEVQSFRLEHLHPLHLQSIHRSRADASHEPESFSKSFVILSMISTAEGGRANALNSAHCIVECVIRLIYWLR